MVMLGAVAKVAGKKAVQKAMKAAGMGISTAKVSSRYRRRRIRLLSLSQREELMWITRHIGKTAAAERMAQYRRR